MIALALALLVQDADLVVVGKRFDATRGTVGRNLVTGKRRCRVTRTSGDAAIDNGVCEVAMHCLDKGRGEAFRTCVRDGRARFLDTYFASKQVDDAQD
ncbi:hypothetical protein [Sphingomonas yantingensis]|uniref:Uncharacterized protein n=1 Tax=Sphingomonas yantingensis TaxID=1241761 RepID=A0A7W9ASA1_9SPHN|nr:hypothetical protein [Sphingomonas yantingensis]MBB5699655.1 hypothetical protein [Sphingomonas yantingensis]